MKPNILFIDVNQDLFSRYSGSLEDQFNILYHPGSGTDLDVSLPESPDVIIFEMNTESRERGLTFLKNIQNDNKFLPVLLLTDESNVALAEEALNYGAFNFLPKNSTPAELKLQIESLLKFRFLLSRAHLLELQDEKNFEKIIGFSREIENIKETLTSFAANDDPIIIFGERGSGKETIARGIHKKSSRSSKPFVSITCNAIPKELMEIEIFGHEKFENDFFMSKKPGKLELADGGTIFFDEISELDSSSQQRLLKFINEGNFSRVGGSNSLTADVRIISSTSRDMDEVIKAGTFREDLYFLIDVLPLKMPPIRERIEDIPYFMEHFAKKASLEYKVPFNGFSERATKVFLEYDWPGNIKELQNYVSNAVINAAGKLIEPNDIASSVIIKEINHDYSIERIPRNWEEMEQMKKEASYRASRRIEKIFLESLLNNGRLSNSSYLNKFKAS